MNAPTDAARSPECSRPRAAACVLWVLHTLEDAVLALLLGALIVLATLQIVLRNFFDLGIAWLGPLLRFMVLWLGLLGALAAARREEHISIDLLGELVRSERIQRLARAAAGLATALVCAVVAYHGARFVASDYQSATRAFASVPAWALETIIPISFFLIAVRYLLHSVHALVRFQGRVRDP